jgi:uncharacterized protein YegP (UPF0339 family)
MSSPVFVDVLPSGAVGKLLRNELRRFLMDHDDNVVSQPDERLEDDMSNHAHFEIRRTAAGQYFWQLRIGDDRLVADSAEAYATIDECRSMITWVQQHGGVMPVEDRTAEASYAIDHGAPSRD